MAASPYDEPEIGNDDQIIRRVDPQQHVVFDENTQRLRLSSKLFSPSSGPSGGMSVDIPRLIEHAGIDVRSFVINPKYSGAVYFVAIDARKAGLRVGYDPIDGNPYHGEVWGAADTPNRFTVRQKRMLARASRWFVALPDVDIEA